MRERAGEQVFYFFFMVLNETAKIYVATNSSIDGSGCAFYELMAGNINFGEEPSVARGGVTSGRQRDHITLIGSVRIRGPGWVPSGPKQGRLFIYWISFGGKIFTVYQIVLLSRLAS